MPAWYWGSLVAMRHKSPNPICRHFLFTTFGTTVCYSRILLMQDILSSLSLFSVLCWMYRPLYLPVVPMHRFCLTKIQSFCLWQMQSGYLILWFHPDFTVIFSGPSHICIESLQRILNIAARSFSKFRRFDHNIQILAYDPIYCPSSFFPAKPN